MRRTLKTAGPSSPLKVATRNGLPALDGDMATRWPDVPCPVKPYDNRIVVQLRLPSDTIGKFKLLRPEETKDADQWHEQIGRVVAVGPRAFHSLQTGEPWPEGPWFTVGDIVHVPRHAMHKVKVPNPNDAGRHVVFATLREIDVVGLVVGSPLDIEFQS